MALPDSFLGDVASNFPDALRDESRRVGKAESISFPKSEEDIRRHLAAAAAQGLSVTVQGARTGLTAGAVPEGGHILNLGRMNRILALREDPAGRGFLVAAEPGVLLAELRAALEKKDFPFGGAGVEQFRGAAPHFFTADPTETSASIGGMVACNASGARSFAYGPTRSWVESLRVVLADGSVLALHRGAPRTSGRHFAVEAEGGKRFEGQVPSYVMPAVKNAAGYHAADNMDLMDLFIGAEGTLGVVSQIELLMIPSPASEWGIMAFFPGEDAALAFVKAVRFSEPRPVAVEFFDAGALNLLRNQRQTNPAFAGLPEMPPAWHTGIYVEYHGASEEILEAAVMAMSEVMVECGGDADATWLTTGGHEMERLKTFRHAIPEAVNLLIDERRKREPGLTKLGTDLSVPDDSLDAVMAMYHEGLSRTELDHVIFGHIGNNHVHVNIIPATLADYEKGKALYLEWAGEVVAMGGSISAEHGVGKLKKALLREMYGDAGIREMQAVKRVFDPSGLLNPGNLF